WLPVSDPGGVVPETRVRNQVRTAKYRPAERIPFALVLQPEGDRFPSSGADGPVRGDRCVAGSGAWRVRSAVPGIQVRVAHPFAERLQHGNLDRLPAAGVPALVESGQDAGVGIHAGGDVSD